MELIFWLLYIIFNIGIAWQNNQVVLRRILVGNKKQIEHFWYGLGYSLICAIPYLWNKDIDFIISLLALHGCVFPVAFNAFRKKEIFHLSQTTSSLFDRIQVYLGFKTSTFVNVLFLLISITLILF